MTEKPGDTMTETRLEATNGQGISFLTGLISGALIGTGIAILFAPQASAALRRLRRQVADTAATAGDAAGERYRQASAQVSDAVDHLHEKGRGAYGSVLGAVARGAQDVKDHATDARIELVRSAPKPSGRHSS
jgi:gas vesicle protein